MRQHGTYAAYSFGLEGQGKGCRCDLCRSANRDYERARSRRVTPAYVGADRSRKHIEWLRDQGVGLKAIAAAAGVSGGALSKLVYGDSTRGRGPSKRVRRSTEDAILAVTALNVKDGARVPGDQYRADVKELRARGWTCSAIARSIGVRNSNLKPDANSVTAAKARAVHDLLAEPVPAPLTRTGLGAAAAKNYDDHQDPDPMPAVLEARREVDKPPTIDPSVFDEPWRKKSACRLLAPEDRWIFWPGRGDYRTIQAAKKVCASCSVSVDCLRYALEAGELGVWGGTTESQRRTMRRSVA